MKCDVCGQEFANSPELEAHMEREHPPEEREQQVEAPPDDVEREAS